MKKTGDFVQAVTNIVGRNMEQTGDYVETFSDRAAQAEVRLKNAQLDLGRAWLPVKESIDSTFTDLQIGVIDATKWLIEHRKIVYSLTAAMTFYTIAVKGYTAIQNGANISLDLFNKLSKKNVIGLIAAGIAAAIPWLISFINRTKEAANAQNELAAAEREATKSAAAETAKVKSLYGATQDATRSMDERLAAVKKMKSEYPSYFGDLSNEAILAGQASSAYRQLASDILAAAKARTYQGKIDEIASENVRLEEQLQEEEKWLKAHALEFAKAWEKMQGVGAGDGLLAKIVAKGSGGYTVRQYQGRQEKAAELRRKINSNEATIGQYGDKILENQPAADRLAGNTPTATVEPTKPKKTGGGDGKDDAFQSDLAALEKNRREALNILKQSLVDGKVTEAEFQAEQQAKQMAYLQAKIALEKQYGKDSSETEGQMLDAVISEANAKHQQLLAEERENEQARLQQRREMLQQMEQAEKDALTGGNYAEALFQAEMMYSLDRPRDEVGGEVGRLRGSVVGVGTAAVGEADYSGAIRRCLDRHHGASGGSPC